MSGIHKNDQYGIGLHSVNGPTATASAAVIRIGWTITGGSPGEVKMLSHCRRRLSLPAAPPEDGC